MKPLPTVVAVRSQLLQRAPTISWSDATANVNRLEFVVAEVETDDGMIGIGLSYTVGLGGSAILAVVRDALTPLLLGTNLGPEERLSNSLTDALRRVGRAGISGLGAAAIETAAWDARARRGSRPLWQELGGSPKEQPTYISGIDLRLTPEQLHGQISDAVRNGALAYKMKVGRDSLIDDVDRVAAARDALGPNRALMLDANEAWTVVEALPRLAAFAAFDPVWVEEPLSTDDLTGYTELRRRQPVPIAAGENMYSADECLTFLKAGAVDVLQPDLARLGGVGPFLEVASMAESFGVPVAPHYLYEMSAHVLAAAPNAMWLENVVGGGLHELGLVASALHVESGRAQMPSGSGWGVVRHDAADESA